MSPQLDRTHPDAPKYWRDEVSGRLAAAVRSYLDNPAAMTVSEMKYLRAYLAQWIMSPVWDMNPYQEGPVRAELTRASEAASRLQELRAGVGAIADALDLQAWIHAATEAGIDPL